SPTTSAAPATVCASPPTAPCATACLQRRNGQCEISCAPEAPTTNCEPSAAKWCGRRRPATASTTPRSSLPSGRCPKSAAEPKRTASERRELFDQLDDVE